MLVCEAGAHRWRRLQTLWGPYNEGCGRNNPTLINVCGSLSTLSGCCLGAPELCDGSDDRNPAEDVLLVAGRKLQSLNRRLTV